jgi:hypothetical protein
LKNYISILALQEKDIHRVVFAKDFEEAGINAVYDPETDSETYQVFVHKRLPFREVQSWSFPDFSSARVFAAKNFSDGWDFLSWDLKTRRPCENGGKECGSGDCDTCRSIKAEGEALGEGCGTATGSGSCGHA